MDRHTAWKLIFGCKPIFSKEVGMLVFIRQSIKHFVNSSQLAKLKKSIPDMPLP